MKATIQSIIFLFVLPFLLFACNKDEDLPKNQWDLSDRWDCHQKTTWDSLKTNNTLIGEWEWEYISCYDENSQNGNGEDFKGLTIEFKSDNTLDIKENGQLPQTSTWEVISAGNGFFAIEVDLYIWQLSGVILFCGEKVAFISSIGDGCDHYFTKK